MLRIQGICRGVFDQGDDGGDDPRRRQFEVEVGGCRGFSLNSLMEFTSFVSFVEDEFWKK